MTTSSDKPLRWNSKLIRHTKGGFSIDSFDGLQWLEANTGEWISYSRWDTKAHEDIIATFKTEDAAMGRLACAPNPPKTWVPRVPYTMVCPTTKTKTPLDSRISALESRVDLLESRVQNQPQESVPVPIHYEVVQSPNDRSLWMIATMKDPKTMRRRYYQAHSRALVVNADAGSDFADYRIAELVCEELNRRENHGPR